MSVCFSKPPSPLKTIDSSPVQAHAAGSRALKTPCPGTLRDLLKLFHAVVALPVLDRRTEGIDAKSQLVIQRNPSGLLALHC